VVTGHWLLRYPNRYEQTTNDPTPQFPQPSESSQCRLPATAQWSLLRVVQSAHEGLSASFQRRRIFRKKFDFS
jgi:hypothetical protein